MTPASEPEAPDAREHDRATPNAPVAEEGRSYASWEGRPGEPCGAMQANGERCGVKVPVNRLSGCSERHKVKLWDEKHPRMNRPDQAALRFDPPASPIPPVNPTVAPQARRRLQRKAIAVLERLREGPVDNAELLRVGGFRFGARLCEVREHLRWLTGRGRDWEPVTVVEDKSTGHAVYTLNEEG